MTPDGIEDAFEVSSGIISDSPINKPAPVVVVNIENLFNFIKQIVVLRLLVSSLSLYPEKLLHIFQQEYNAL